MIALAGCSDNEATLQGLEADGTLSPLTETADERTIFHQIDINLRTPLSSGEVRLYRLMDGTVVELERYRFDNPDPSLHIAYSAPISTSESAVLIHVLTAGRNSNQPDEYVCFAQISHRTSRHNNDVDCDLSSTVDYYLSAVRIGRSSSHPFHDITERLPLWSSLVEAKDNDVNGFYVSVFGTIHKALVGLGGSRFNSRVNSIRPIMETVTAQFIDLYQRKGAVTATDLIQIVNDITDNSLPLERLIRYQTVFEEHAHIADVDLTNTGGSLTQRTREIELLTLSSELSRFFLRDSPYEMSDYRTHIVQDIDHSEIEEGVYVHWDPIAHMYGYNVYFNGEHVGYSRVPGILLPRQSRGIVTVKAVGYAGEFDGVHHELSGPTLIAGTSNESD